MSAPAANPDFPPEPHNSGGGVPPPPPNVGHPSATTDEERMLSTVNHLGGVLLSWLVPLIIFMMYPVDKSRFTNDHAKEALNFQITLFIGYFVSGLLMFVLIGFLLFPLLWIFSLIFGIKAAMAANSGQPYRYPMTLRLLK